MTSKKYEIPADDDEEDEPRVQPLFRRDAVLDKGGNASTAPSTAKVNSTAKAVAEESKAEPAKSSASGATAMSESGPERRKFTHKSNCILVNEKQRGNLLLHSIKCLPWEYAQIVPDYLMSSTTCALFLSLKYHSLYPNYIYDRLKVLGKSYKLQVLLVLVDIKDPGIFLKELAKVGVLADCTLMCCWSYEEAGKIIETYKMFEHKSPQMIMEKLVANANGTEGSYKCAIEALSCVKSINKTDAISLVSTFESLDKIVMASPDQLSMCTGLGPQKAEKLHQMLRRPFKRS